MGKLSEIGSIDAEKRVKAPSLSHIREPIKTTAGTRFNLRFLRPVAVERFVGAVDFFLIVFTSLACGTVYQWLSNVAANWGTFVGIGVLVGGNFTAIMRTKENYQIKNLTRTAKQLRDAVAVWSGIYGMLAVIGFTMKISSDFSRGATILSFVVGGAALIFWRVLIVSLISRALNQGWFAKRQILVIAEHGRAISSAALMELDRHGLTPIQLFELSDVELTAVGVCSSLRRKLSDLVSTAQANKIKDIYLLIGWNNKRVIDNIISILTILPVSIHLIPDEATAVFLRNPVLNLGDTWAVELAREPLTAAERAGKRSLDLLLASLAIILLLPLMMITALLIKLDSKGPVIFLQKRNGFSGHAFNIFKFRTMIVLEDGRDIRQTVRNDPRVTRLGRWLRRSSIEDRLC